MPGARLEQGRLVDIALAIDAMGAARVKAAARRRMQQARRLAARHRALVPGIVRIRVGDGRQQRFV
jgi:hypothetical protein